MTDTPTQPTPRTGQVDALLYGEVAERLAAELRTLSRMSAGSRIEWARIDARADGLAIACEILSGESADLIRGRLAETIGRTT